jgi:hypothetical protein
MKALPSAARGDAAKRSGRSGGVFAGVKQGLLEESVLRGWLEEGLTEAEDRELFHLAPPRAAR